MSENGSDYISGHVYASEDGNEDKNHNRMADPETNLASAQAGMLASDSEDNEMRHKITKADGTSTWIKLLRAGIVCVDNEVVCVDNEVVFISIA